MVGPGLPVEVAVAIGIGLGVMGAYLGYRAIWQRVEIDRG